MNTFDDDDILSNFAANLLHYINKFKNVKIVFHLPGGTIEYSYKSFNDFCFNADIDVKALRAITNGSVKPRLSTVKKIIDFLHQFDKNITLESMLSGIIQ